MQTRKSIPNLYLLERLGLSIGMRITTACACRNDNNNVMLIDGNVFWLQSNDREGTFSLPFILDYHNKKSPSSILPMITDRQTCPSKLQNAGRAIPCCSLHPYGWIFLFFLNIVVSYDWLHVESWKCQKVVNSDTASLKSKAIHSLLSCNRSSRGSCVFSYRISRYFLVFGSEGEMMPRHLSHNLIFLSSNRLLYFSSFRVAILDLVRMGLFFLIFLGPKQRYHVWWGNKQLKLTFAARENLKNIIIKGLIRERPARK